MTERGATATLDALALGATDYIAKPAHAASAAHAIQSVKDQLPPKIKSLCPDVIAPLAKKISGEKQPGQSSVENPNKSKRYEIVVIGSSTGGPQALSKLIGQLPANFPVPVVVVQHMPPVFTRHLATRLNKYSSLDVKEASGGEPLKAGQVLLAPGDFHLELTQESGQVTTVLQQTPHENSCRPAVDVLFRSAAKVYGDGCLAVILTGMGTDGLRGSKAIVQNGGNLLAQDESTSVVWGMPRAVLEAGLASRTLPVPLIANELKQLTSIGRCDNVLS